MQTTVRYVGGTARGLTWRTASIWMGLRSCSYDGWLIKLEVPGMIGNMFTLFSSSCRTRTWWISFRGWTPQFRTWVELTFRDYMMFSGGLLVRIIVYVVAEMTMKTHTTQHHDKHHA